MKRPKRCECGGLLVYTWSFRRWWVFCEACTGDGGAA